MSASMVRSHEASVLQTSYILIPFMQMLQIVLGVAGEFVPEVRIQYTKHRASLPEPASRNVSRRRKASSSFSSSPFVMIPPSSLQM